MVAVPEELAGTPPGCFLDAMGMRLTHIGVGRARAEMMLTPLHLNQRGGPQGGALVAFADAVAGWASDGAVPAGNFATFDLTCHLLSRADAGTTLVAEARPVHIGRRSIVQDVDVFSAADERNATRRLMARFTCTQLVLPFR
jgi:uncharacterized protein (TIGR00369 family)